MKLFGRRRSTRVRPDNVRRRRHHHGKPSRCTWPAATAVKLTILLLLVCCTTTLPDAVSAAESSRVRNTTTGQSANGNADLDCPFGSELNTTLNRCVQICTNDAVSNGSNGQCVNRPRDAYNVAHGAELHAAAADDEPAVHVKLPACKNMTLVANEFSLSPDGNLTVTIGKVTQLLQDYQLSDDGQSVNVCYPLSPQLLQCSLRRLDRPSYHMLADRTLVNRYTNDTIGVRDYYMSWESQGILACTEAINPDRKLRCNYIRYKSWEYRFDDEANTTLRLLPTNTSIYRPQYTKSEDGTMRVCYPFSPFFTRCELWVLEAREFAVRQDRILMDTIHDMQYNMSNYLITGSGQAVVCAIPLAPLIAPFDFYYIHGVFYIISAICLFVAFVVHLLVPSLNYHAKPLLCHMICMLVMYISLSIRKFSPSIQPTWCYTLFVMTYYSSMASFFWLNVLSFDLWNIFANLQTTSKLSCSCRFTRHRLLYYNLYAWCMPALLCTAAIVLDTNPTLQQALNLYPRIPAMCWFNDRNTAYALLYIPMSIVLLVNLALFVDTVYNLRKASRGVELVNKQLNKQLLFVCFKLFIIMGFCWTGEAISWAAGTHVEAFYLPDAINAVQGIIIFMIYICKPATYRLVRDKFFSRTNSDGKWTMDFNTSRTGAERKTSTSGLSTNGRDSSVKNGRSANRNGSVSAQNGSLRFSNL